MFRLGSTPGLIFGAGAQAELPAICERYGKNLLLVTGKSSFEKNGYDQNILNSLYKRGFQIHRAKIVNEPSALDIDNIVHDFRNKNLQCIISIGGGSVIDAGKAISAMLPVKGSVEDYLEGVGTKTHPGDKIPFIAMPTTAGTGSEATKNAVISKMGNKGYKKSLRHNNFTPDYAIIDPELALNCPPEITAATGMDAFSQLVESYLSTRANAYTDALALDGIKKVIASLEPAVKSGKNLDARADMALAAFFSGITLANAGLGVVHGFAQPLGSMFPIPHGTVCGTLMAPVNIITLRKLDQQRDKLIWQKYKMLGTLTGKKDIPEHELPNQFIRFLVKLTENLAIPGLSSFNVSQKHIGTILNETGQKNHPVKLSKDELAEILMQRL